MAKQKTSKKSTKKAPQKRTLKKKLNEVISVVAATCEAKGWSHSIESIDDQKWKYTSITIERWVSNGKITGLLNISINGGVKTSLSKTSFYNYGLNDLLNSIIDDLQEIPWLEKKKKNEDKTSINTYEFLEKILRQVHIVARQLKYRHDDRETLIIDDEYDVQDLLNALLRVCFEDVRPEEYTPSYAGSSSRVDFLLKTEKIVVEVKMASKKLRDKLVGEQLIIDIKKYQSHPDCNFLYCLVYDANSFIKNPVALENDLSGKHDKLDVKVFVVPH